MRDSLGRVCVCAEACWAWAACGAGAGCGVVACAGRNVRFCRVLGALDVVSHLTAAV